MLTQLSRKVTLAPNSIRILQHLGVWEATQKQGTVFETMHLVRVPVERSCSTG
jgi:2-polyprenyl-6-methoxyphenol hydroxylase-like FAD-dependent oxidoreductase